MAYSSEALKQIDYDRAMKLSYWAEVDAENNRERDRSKFRSDAEYSVYLESLKWERYSLGK